MQIIDSSREVVMFSRFVNCIVALNIVELFLDIRRFEYQLNL